MNIQQFEHFLAHSPKILFNALSRRLEKEFGTLPEYGIIAGQAPASACYEMLKLGTGPFRDLDVFSHCMEGPKNPYTCDPEWDSEQGDDGEFYHRGNCRNHRELESTAQPLSHASSSFPCTKKGMNELSAGRYFIIDSFSDIGNPRVNHVHVRFPDAFKRSVVGKGVLILNGFDINACQIALDMKNRTVHCSKDFINFLHRPEIKVTFYGTPMHTAIRLLKKRNDLSFGTLNVEFEMARLQTARQIIHEMELTRKSGFIPGNLFSNIYAKRFREFENELAPYFSIKPKSISYSNYGQPVNTSEKTPYQSYEVTRNFHILEPTKFCATTVEYYKKAFIGVDKEINSISWFNGIIRPWMDWFFQGQSISPVDSLLNAICQSDHKPWAECQKWLWGTSIHEKFRSVKLIGNEKLKRAIKFINKHPRATSHLTRMPLHKTLTTIPKLRYLEKNKMSYYVGWMEIMSQVKTPCDLIVPRNTISMPHSVSADSDDPSDASDHQVSLLSPTFTSQVKATHDNYMKLLKRRATPARFDDVTTQISDETGYFLRELNSGYSLFLEGEQMGHCVGGYCNYVLSGHFIIFSIDTDGNGKPTSRSTLCIVINEFRDDDDTAGVYIQQHYGKGNKEAPEGHDDIAEMIKDRIVATRRAMDINHPANLWINHWQPKEDAPSFSAFLDAA